MKRLFLFLGMVLVSLTGFAQEALFMFEKFEEANMFFKEGTFSRTKINYELAQGKFIYIQDEDFMEMPDDNPVVRVEFDDKRVFYQREPNKFYEKVHRGNYDVFIHWKIHEMKIGEKGAYGTTTQAGVSSMRLTTLPGGGNIATKYEAFKENPMYSSNVYQQKTDNTYLVNKGGKEVKIKTLKNVYKVFSNHQAEIKQYVDEYKLSMTNAEEALQVLDYAMGLE